MDHNPVKLPASVDGSEKNGKKLITRKLSEHEYTTYPRRFDSYKWYKPILVSILFGVFAIIAIFGTEAIGKIFFSESVPDTGGYDDMDFFTVPGAFSNGISAAIPILCLILAAKIVKDRPLSSYFSSMGGWRHSVSLRLLQCQRMEMIVRIMDTGQAYQEG